MDAKEAVDAARKCLTDALPRLAPDQIGLEQVVPGLAKRDWRVTFSFPSLEAQQGQQSAIAKRSYKELTISDADGSLICITACTPCSPKSCKISCTAGQCAQPSCATPVPMSWGDSVRSWMKVLFVYPTAAVGWASLTMLYIKLASGGPHSEEVVISSAALFVGVVVGLFAEGRWWLRGGRRRCGNKKK